MKPRSRSLEVLVFVVGFVLAVLIDQKIRFENTFRTIFLYPFALSFIVTGLVWQWILDPGLGVPKLLADLGLPGGTLALLGNKDTVIYALVIAGLWQGTGLVMVLMLGQCRVLFAMARDGLLPRALAKTGSRGTPIRITALVAAVVAATASVFPITKLEEMVNVGTLFAFVLVSAGVLVLRRTRPDLERGFKAPWVPVLPIASIAACAWLMLNLTALTWVRFGVWLVVGTAIYAGYGYRHSVQGRREEVETEHSDSLEADPHSPVP